jgi:SAM-dependent methyltransferase
MNEPEIDAARSLAAALWRISRRPERPQAWVNGGNLPWNDPAFSARMLREHLDESHGAASRRSAERAAQIDWLWTQLDLAPGRRVLDLTCGPGLYAVALAQRGCTVTGIDFGPAAIAYARQFAAEQGVAARCEFIEHDVRSVALPAPQFDAALILYGQLAVFTRAEAADLLRRTLTSLKPGGRLCVELLEQERVNKLHSTWWFTDAQGLWGDAPFLHLGERFWDDAQALSLERFYTLHLATGQLDEVLLCDQTYGVDELRSLLLDAGSERVVIYPAWDGLPVADAAEWNVYLAQKQ